MPTSPEQSSPIKVSEAPFGLWASTFSPRAMASGKRLTEALWDTDGETLVWLEGRGDGAVLVAAGGRGREAPRDLTTDLGVRAKLGYGGGDFTVHAGVVYFSEAKSGRLYRQELCGGAARPITPAFGALAAPRVTPDGRHVLFVHHDSEAVDRIAVADTKGREWPRILHQGHDFYAYPRVSPDGRHVAFVAWDHPNMPWDGTWLYLAPLVTEGHALPHLGEARRVAGGKDVAIFQPEFTPDGTLLLYVSDESGIGNVHAADLASGAPRAITTQKDADLGRPAWVQEMRSYAVLPDSKSVVVAVNDKGFVRTSRLDLASGKLTPIPALSDVTDVAQLTADPVRGELALIGSSAAFPPRVLLSAAGGDAKAAVVCRGASESYAESEISRPETLTWATGPTAKEVSHGLYYAPKNPAWRSEGLPPLIVLVHGGPTSQVRAGWSREAQFFTSRGYGVLYVNHRGSTGYGRAYMLRHRGTWGEVDVEDSVSGAQYLAKLGRIDGKKTVIMGGSAGGFTVLQAMVDQPEAFTAGICLYGIANQFSLLAATHKFEERYNDTLLGALPGAAELWRRRSPVFHAARIKRPLAVFQGEIDNVVPKEQSETIVSALRRNGTPHVYHLYPGEGHGWRKPETLEHYWTEVDRFLKEHVVYA